MNKFLYVVVCCFMSFLLCSCGNDDEGQDEFHPSTDNPYLKIESGTETQMLSYDGGSINLWIDSNTDWVCAVSGDNNLKMKADKSKGYGKDVVVLTYASTRDKTIDHNITATFTITWQGKYSKESLTKSFYRQKNPVY